MTFIRHHLGRIVMMLLLIIAAAVYLIFRVKTGVPTEQTVKMTFTLAAVCLKLYIAFYLVYLLMLIVKMGQDAAYSKSSKDEKFAEHAAVQNGSMAFTIVLAIVTAAIYLGLQLGGFFTF